MQQQSQRIVTDTRVSDEEKAAALRRFRNEQIGSGDRDTRHTDDGRPVTYNLLYSIAYNLGSTCTESVADTIADAIGARTELWIAERRDDHLDRTGTPHPRLPSGGLSSVAKRLMGDPDKVIPTRTTYFVEYNGEHEVTGINLADLEALVYSDLRAHYVAVVQEIGPVSALIDVGSRSYKAETKAGVAKFTELTFGVVKHTD